MIRKKTMRTTMLIQTMINAQLEQKPAGGDGQDDRNDRGVERWLNDDYDYIDDNYNNNEQTTFTKVEMDKMTEMIGELRENCNVLQQDLLSARQDDTRCNLDGDRRFPNEVGS